MMGFWDAVASAGPYANNLHIAADIYYYYYCAAFNTPCVCHKDDELQAQDKSQAWITKPSPHRSIFYKPYALPDAQPTASKH